MANAGSSRRPTRTNPRSRRSGRKLVDLIDDRWTALLHYDDDIEAPMTLTLDINLPDDLQRLRLPAAVAARLQNLLDRQDSGQPLTSLEREEAEGLVNVAELLTLLRLRAERASS